MDNKKVAEELIRIAKSITSYGSISIKETKVEFDVSDLNKDGFLGISGDIYLICSAEGIKQGPDSYSDVVDKLLKIQGGIESKFKGLSYIDSAEIMSIDVDSRDVGSDNGIKNIKDFRVTIEFVFGITSSDVEEDIKRVLKSVF